MCTTALIIFFFCIERKENLNKENYKKRNEYNARRQGKKHTNMVLQLLHKEPE